MAHPLHDPPASRTVSAHFQALRPLLALAVAAALWLPCAHRVFTPRGDRSQRLEDRSAAMHARALHPERWEADLLRQRAANPEWDLMQRTFLVLGLAEHALQPGSTQHLAEIDRLVRRTVDDEQEHGQAHFLLPYVHRAPFRQAPARSAFVDGEIALMLATRLMLQDDPTLRAELTRRVDLLSIRMAASPTSSIESYPDECWMFCNAIAVAAIRMSDGIDGRSHDGLVERWFAQVRDRFVDPETGLVMSSFTYDGTPLDGPEGSSVFLVAHMLRLVDPAFAARQYELAREALMDQVLGFGYAREWPARAGGSVDIDSGPTIPGLEANAGASGMAVLGAGAFGDGAWMDRLETSLALAAFPVEGGTRYAASNGVGDAVLAYGFALGAQEGQSRLFRLVEQRLRAHHHAGGEG